jgi:hypothetical protein
MSITMRGETVSTGVDYLPPGVDGVGEKGRSQCVASGRTCPLLLDT